MPHTIKRTQKQRILSIIACFYILLQPTYGRDRQDYGIAKSTINGWVKDVKEIKVDENEVMTLKEVKALKKEMARIKEENEILHQRRALAKKAMAIFATRN